jgi:hypothetical protein
MIAHPSSESPKWVSWMDSIVVNRSDMISDPVCVDRRDRERRTHKLATLSVQS